MKRSIKNFIRSTVVTLEVLFPSIIRDSEVFDLKSLLKNKSSINLYDLERVIMTNALFFDNYSEKLIEWKNEMTEESGLNEKIKPIKQDLIDLSLSTVKRFSKGVSWKISDKVLRSFDSLYADIDSLKKNQKLYFINYENQVLLLKNDLTPYANILAEGFIQDLNILNLKDSLNNDKYEGIFGLFNTLDRLAPEALFIKDACEKSGISLETAISHFYNETFGREFAVSNIGAIGRSQINSQYLIDIYNYVTSQNNELSGYIKQNTSIGTFLEDLAINPNLNVATGINLMNYNRQKTKTYYVTAYLIGINGISNLSSSIKYKLRNPSKIVKKDLRNIIIRYYYDFVNTKKNFAMIRNYLD